MEFLTFDALQQQLLSHFKAAEYEEVRQLAAEQIQQFPERFHILAYWQITAAARQKEYSAAIQLISGLLDKGFWYGESVLLNSPSLEPLQEMPEFIDLINRSRLLRQQFEKSAFPLLILRQPDRCQKEGPPCPLLLGLHTNGGTVQDSLDFWKPAATEGWIVAAPQSSQAIWKGAYVWDDRSIAADDLERHYLSVKEKYHIDPRRIVLAGHSLGGETAIWLALTSQIPVQGFIAFGLTGPLTEDPERWRDLVDQAATAGLRGYIIFGEEDESIPQENIRLLVELLNEAGIPTDLESVPLAGHDYDPAYADCLLRALEFIFPSSGGS